MAEDPKTLRPRPGYDKDKGDEAMLDEGNNDNKMRSTQAHLDEARDELHRKTRRQGKQKAQGHDNQSQNRSNHQAQAQDSRRQTKLEYRQGQGQNMHSQGSSSKVATSYEFMDLEDLQEEAVDRGLAAEVRKALTEILIADDEEPNMDQKPLSNLSKDSGATRATRELGIPPNPPSKKNGVAVVTLKKGEEAHRLEEDMARERNEEQAEADARLVDCRLKNITTFSRLKRFCEEMGALDIGGLS